MTTVWCHVVSNDAPFRVNHASIETLMYIFLTFPCTFGQNEKVQKYYI